MNMNVDVNIKLDIVARFVKILEMLRCRDQIATVAWWCATATAPRPTFAM